VGDVNGDGRNEIIVATMRWEGENSTSRIYILRKASKQEIAPYEATWTPPQLPYAISSLNCLRLGKQTVIAAGGVNEVRFFSRVGKTYEEAADRRIDLRQLVPEGYSNPAYPVYPVFGPGVGLVTAVVSLESQRGTRLALTANNNVSDIGGGGLAILRWQKIWQVEQIIPLKRQPEALAVGNFLPEGASALLVKSRDAADLENLILYGRRDGQWAGLWRTGPQREGEPLMKTAGFTFADKGKLLAIAANYFAGDNNFQRAEIKLYQCRNDQMQIRAQLVLAKPLLALIPIPDKKQTRFIVIQTGGQGQEIIYTKP